MELLQEFDRIGLVSRTQRLGVPCLPEALALTVAVHATILVCQSIPLCDTAHRNNDLRSREPPCTKGDQHREEDGEPQLQEMCQQTHPHNREDSGTPVERMLTPYGFPSSLSVAFSAAVVGVLAGAVFEESLELAPPPHPMTLRVATKISRRYRSFISRLAVNVSKKRLNTSRQIVNFHQGRQLKRIENANGNDLGEACALRGQFEQIQ